MGTGSTSRLINRAIASLINGVSQQPDALRLASQAAAQVNGYSTLVEGLKKRPPTSHVAKLNADTDNDTFVHYINRDTVEQYTLLIKDASLRMYNLAGVEMSYVWETKTVTSLNAVAAVVDGTAFQIYIPESVTTATLASSGIGTATVVWEQSTTGAFAGEETTVRTDTTDTSAAATVTGGYYYRATVTAYTSGTITATIQYEDSEYLHVTGNPRDSFAVVTIADFTLLVNKEKTVAMDAATLSGGTNKGTVQSFSALPGSPITNDVWEIAGDPNNNFDNYYVKWDGSAWREAPKVGIETTIDAATMPHTLTRTAVDTFTYSKSTWGTRDVGDLTSSPDPSFIGKTLNDIFFHRNRLGVLAGENCVMTTNPASDFDFFRESATVLIDSDPIDIAATSTKVSTLYHAVPFDKSLLLMSEQTQFILSGTSVLSPHTATLDTATEFEASILAPPAAAGPNLYFPVSKGLFTGIREYFVEDEVTTNDAADVTGHVPAYIAPSIFSLVPSSNEDVLFTLSSNATNRHKVWVYKYYWQGNEKVQSAWSDWVFDTNDVILGMGIFETDVYMVVKRADGTYLNKFSLQTRNPDTDMGFQVLLDRKELVTGSYDGGNDWTTWTMSCPHSNDAKVILGPEWSNPGKTLDTLTYPTSTTIRKTGDHSANTVYVGIPYTFTYTFSKFYLKDGNKNAIREGRLMMRYMKINYEDTGYFTVTVTPKFRDPYVTKLDRDPSSSTFTGVVLGGGDALLGQIQIVDGTLQVPLISDSELVDVTIGNDSHLPSNFQSAEWTALYHGLASRS